MQYKIPVQIENEDPIFLWLSIRQLSIIMIWLWIAYSIFKSLSQSVWPEAWAIPAIFIAILSIIVAIFKQYEMTFVPFVLSLIRYNVNWKTRKWEKWVDSFSPLSVWYIILDDTKKIEKIDFETKIDKIKKLEENLEKI